MQNVHTESVEPSCCSVHHVLPQGKEENGHHFSMQGLLPLEAMFQK